MHKTYLSLLAVLAALTSVASAAAMLATGSGAFTYRGTVTHIVAGDTLDVRLASGRVERIRLIGIDTPERGVCYSANATERARQLAMSKPVVLRGDPTQDARDRYGRLLAYVWVPGGNDSPCIPVVGDLDCPDIRALGVAPVRVLGSDPYRLDADNDGWGCE